MPGREKPAIELVFTAMHPGPTFDGHHPHIHMTDRGVGLSCVNALSSRTDVETVRAGRRYRIAFECGHTVEPLADLGPTSRRGTQIRFRPDPTIFETAEVDPAPIREQLTNLAFLNPLLDVRFQGRAIDGRGGPASFVRALAGNRLACPTIFATTRTIDDVFVDVAIGWRDRGEPEVRSFVNMLPTRTGTHVKGLWSGLTVAAKRIRPAILDLLGPGLVAVLHVGLFDPSFGGPTREHLSTPLAGPAVERAIAEALPAVRRDARLGAFLDERLSRHTRV